MISSRHITQPCFYASGSLDSPEA